MAPKFEHSAANLAAMRQHMLWMCPGEGWGRGGPLTPAQTAAFHADVARAKAAAGASRSSGDHAIRRSRNRSPRSSERQAESQMVHRPSPSAVSSRSRSRSPSLTALVDRHSDVVAAVQEVEDDDRRRRSRSPCACGNPRRPLTMRMRDGERNDQNEDADFAGDVAVIADDEDNGSADCINIPNIANNP